MSFKDDIDQENILELQHILNQFRKRAEKVGLTEEDIHKEVEKIRNK